MRRDTDELLAAYVDGVTELAADERRRVEARLGDAPALRSEAEATRALLGELRELPRGGEPDWSALERSIGDAVGTDVPRRWRGWRWLVPGLALATAGAVAVLVLHDPGEMTTPAPDPVIAHEHAKPAPAPDVVPSDLPFWLDGQAVEVESEVLDAIDAELTDDTTADDDALLSTSDLEWIDSLDDADLERAERWLDERPTRKQRKKS